MHPDLAHFLEYAAYAAVAAVIAGMVKEGKLALPRLYRVREEDGTKTYIDPGFLATAFLGGIVGGAVDGRPYTAIFAGVFSVYVGREILKPLVAGVLKQYLPGFTFETPTPADVAEAAVRAAGKAARKAR